MENSSSQEKPDHSKIDRRVFLGATTVAGLGMLAGCGDDNNPKPVTATTPGTMPMRELGSTGVKVSAIGLGGFHIGSQSTEEESIKIIRCAIDGGITFLDNCWDYNKGQSEVRMGNALKDGYRQKIFLMTKLDGRDKKAAALQLEESMRRLQTDVIDLVQMHEVIRMTDPDRIFAEGGGIEALIEARKAGKIRFIGFTGHKNPDIHLKMLDVADAHHFKFDTVQMPINVMDAHYESFEKKVLPRLLQNKIGTLSMKALGDKIILKSKTVTPVECLQYALTVNPGVVITGCDSIPILEQALEVGRSFKPLEADQIAALLAKTASAAVAGEFEKYKTSTQFDGTTQNPQWLG